MYSQQFQIMIMMFKCFLLDCYHFNHHFPLRVYIEEFQFYYLTLFKFSLSLITFSSDLLLFASLFSLIFHIFLKVHHFIFHMFLILLIKSQYHFYEVLIKFQSLLDFNFSNQDLL